MLQRLFWMLESTTQPCLSWVPLSVQNDTTWLLCGFGTQVRRGRTAERGELRDDNTSWAFPGTFIQDQAKFRLTGWTRIGICRMKFIMATLSSIFFVLYIHWNLHQLKVFYVHVSEATSVLHFILCQLLMIEMKLDAPLHTFEYFHLKIHVWSDFTNLFANFEIIFFCHLSVAYDISRVLEGFGTHGACCRELCQSCWSCSIASWCKNLTFNTPAAAGPAWESSGGSGANVWPRYTGSGCQCCTAGG